MKLPLDRSSIAQPRDANIHMGHSFGRDYIRSGTPGDHSRVDRDATLQIGELSDAPDLPRQFEDRARARGEVDTGMGCFPANRDAIIADTFASGLELAFESGAGFETSTQSLFAAFFSVSAREEWLPTSSSELSCRSTRCGTGISNSRRTRVAKRKNAMPDFISSTPGPQSRPSFCRNGICRSVPMGHTVSRCPSTSTCPVTCAPAARFRQSGAR